MMGATTIISAAFDAPASASFVMPTSPAAQCEPKKSRTLVTAPVKLGRSSTAVVNEDWRWDENRAVKTGLGQVEDEIPLASSAFARSLSSNARAPPSVMSDPRLDCDVIDLIGIQQHGVAGLHHDCRVDLFDNRGADETVTGSKHRSIVDGGIQPSESVAMLKAYRSSLLDSSPSVRVFDNRIARHPPLALAHDVLTDRQHFDGFLPRVEGIAALVKHMEGLHRLRNAFPLQIARHRRCEFVDLTCVSHLGVPLDRYAFHAGNLAQLRLRGRRGALQTHLQRGSVEIRRQAADWLNLGNAKIRQKLAECAEHGGCSRHEDALDTEVAGLNPDRHAACSAEAHQSKVAGIMPFRY